MQWKSTLFLFCAATLAGSQVSAQTFTTLHNFNGRDDGGYPISAMIVDGAGNLYGTTGRSAGPFTTYGTVFKLSPSGTLTTLHTFTGGADGFGPQGSLVADAAGNLYGTTYEGGDRDAGVVFKITKSGSYVRLHSFCADLDCPDGLYPSGLTADAAGNLYGVALGGPKSSGTIFKITPAGVLTNLYSSFPQRPKSDALLMDKAGNLYGMTAPYDPPYQSQLYKLTPSGTFTILYTFGQGEDPSVSLIDSSGNFYGATYDSVFKLTPGGTLNKLYTFVGGYPAPYAPNSGLIADAAGNLYGTTFGGGTTGRGTIFKLTPTGALTILHSFLAGEGELPRAGLLADGGGNFYGSTLYGGTYGPGTIFKLALPATFWGTPGTPNCVGQSVSFLTKKYGGLAAAATALGYPSVEALQSAIAAYCGTN